MEEWTDDLGRKWRSEPVADREREQIIAASGSGGSAQGRPPESGLRFGEAVFGDYCMGYHLTLCAHPEGCSCACHQPVPAGDLLA